MADLAKFTLVELVSVDADKPTVQAWSPSAYEEPALVKGHVVLGVTMSDSNYEEPVAVMKRGYLRDVAEQNSETWAIGEILYAKSDGSISNTRQAGPLPQALVGTVFDGPDGGDLFAIDVDVRILPAIGELSGVKRETPVALDVLIYEGTSHYWEPRQLVHGTDISGLGAAGDPSNDDHPQYQQETDFIHPFLFSGGN